MPGLIGYVKSKEALDHSLTLAAMAKRLDPEGRFDHEFFEAGPVGIGRVSPGILNPIPQPIWSEDRSLGIVLDGEFYNSPELILYLERRGNPVQSAGDAGIALNLYQELGEGFVNCLKGAFVLAIWDERNHTLLVANDRLGLYPLYYAHTARGLIFSSGVRALLADPAVSRELDRVAIAQFMTFEHVLDDRTLLESVKLLPQASILTFREGALRIHPYWTLSYAEQHRLRDIDEDVQQLNDLLTRAIQRMALDDLPKGILLSGGMDSRMVLALLSEIVPPGRLDTFTWGIPGCDDCRAAGELAAIAKTRHHFFELKPDWLIEKADEAVRLTDGLGNITNLHALAAAPQEGAISKVLFKGFLGDAMFGFAVNRRFWANYDDQTAFHVHVQSHHDHGVIHYDQPEQALVFTPDFQRQVGDAVFESYRAGMRRSNASQLATQRLYFDLTQRVPRMTIHGVQVVRPYAAVRLPFADYDLVDFSLEIPPGYMFERYVAQRAFIENYPKYAKVPNPSTGLPMISCAREILLRARNDLRWHLRKRGLGFLTGADRKPYKDYAGWFRNQLRSWLEGVLLDPRTLERGLFNPDYIRKQVSDHMAGEDRTIRLGEFLTLELWMRQSID